MPKMEFGTKTKLIFVHFFYLVLAVLVVACDKDAVEPVSASLTQCALKPETSACRTPEMKWFYSPEADKCFVALWTGCTYLDPFSSREQCALDCVIQK